MNPPNRSSRNSMRDNRPRGLLNLVQPHKDALLAHMYKQMLKNFVLQTAVAPSLLRIGEARRTGKGLLSMFGVDQNQANQVHVLWKDKIY